MTERSTEDRWFTARDGTRLFARDTGSLGNSLTPLLCLPGITRNSRDFDPVFDQFQGQRRVIAMDFRGRGRSRFANPASYRPEVELEDTLSFLAELGVDRIALLGTSRGGIVGLLMAHMAPARLAGLMLNDIGCKVEPTGLLHIKTYIGKPQTYATWVDVAKALETGSRGFAGVDKASWLRMAHRIYIATPEGMRPSHDPELAQNLPTEEDVRAGKTAELWALLPAMTGKPFGLLHGAGSELLSVTTVAEMKRQAPHLQVTTVPGRGHVPFLDEPESVAAITQWLADVDAQEKGR